MENLPDSLERDTIIDAIFEVKFNDAQPIEILFSEIYTILKTEGFIFERLPHADIPKQIIDTDKNLEFLAFYRLKKDNLNVSIGPKVFGIAMSTPYSGWQKFQDTIIDKLNKFTHLFNQREVRQVSMRYINFFQNENIFDNANLLIQDNFLCDSLTGQKKNYKTFLECNDLELILQIDNKASIKREIDQGKQEGSIVDIDVIAKTVNSIESVMDKIEDIHTFIKITFFKIVKEDYVNKYLKPIPPKEIK